MSSLFWNNKSWGSHGDCLKSSPWNSGGITTSDKKTTRLKNQKKSPNLDPYPYEAQKGIPIYLDVPES